MKKVDYRDSEKFRAEQHRFAAHALMFPLGLDILNMSVFGKVF